MEKIKQLKQLIKKCNEASKAYYNEQELISNKEFDFLMKELKELEKETGVIYLNSPTQTVGYSVLDKFEKRELIYPMLSLDDTKSTDDIKEFIGDKDNILSDKLDGCSCEIVYKNNIQFSATTRGNGLVGEDISNNAKTFLNLPKKIPFKERFVLRCELVISYKNFENFKDDFKNPRNMVAGSIRQLDSSVCAERCIEAIVFDPVETPFEEDNKLLQFVRLSDIGFQCVKCYDLEDLHETLNNVDDKYPTDGKVVTYKSISYSNSLGSTSHHPKHSIAFKWADETHTTTFIDIDWSVSRTGRITPVAVFEPTEIEGSTVSRASCHNVSELKKLNMKEGDQIEIYKANKIIPQIDTNNTKHDVNVTLIPEYCPVCGHKTVFKTENDVETLHCIEPNCKAKIVGKISHFCNVMEMKGISDKIIEKIVENTFVENIDEIFDLDGNDLINIDGFKEKTCNNIISTIKNNKTCSLAQFLRSLGIKHVGKSVSELIAKEYYDYYRTLKNLNWFDISDILIKLISDNNIEGIGDKMFQDISRELTEREDEIYRLLHYVEIEEPKETTESNISGKSFCCTGTLSRKRKEIEQEITDLGGVIKSVSKNLDFLVIGNNAGSKKSKAEKLGIKIITEDELMEMLK